MAQANIDFWSWTGIRSGHEYVDECPWTYEPVLDDHFFPEPRYLAGSNPSPENIGDTRAEETDEKGWARSHGAQVGAAQQPRPKPDSSDVRGNYRGKKSDDHPNNWAIVGLSIS